MNKRFNSRARLACGLGVVLVLAGCASAPTGPSMLVLPGTGRSFDTFRIDIWTVFNMPLVCLRPPRRAALRVRCGAQPSAQWWARLRAPPLTDPVVQAWAPEPV